MSNNNNNFENIQVISYLKLAEYDQTRIDLPIRRYVLISNLLREPSSPSNALEQQWFDTCLNQLDNEEDDIYLHAIYDIRNNKGFIVCTTANL